MTEDEAREIDLRIAKSLDLARNLQGELYVYLKGAAGSGNDFHAQAFANLAARADALVTLLGSPVEAPRALRLDRAEAEFIVDAAERTRIPQWMDLAANVRQLWGMGAFPAGAVPPG